MQLILNTFGASLRKKDGMFLIRAGDRKITMSPRKVQTIWLATGVHLSTDAIRLALEHHVDIALLDKHGEPYGRFWHARLGSTNRSSPPAAGGRRVRGRGAAGPRVGPGQDRPPGRPAPRPGPHPARPRRRAGGHRRPARQAGGRRRQRLRRPARRAAGLADGPGGGRRPGVLRRAEPGPARAVPLPGPEPLAGQGRVQLPAQLRLRRPLLAGRAGLPARRARPLHRPAAHRQLQQALARLRPDRAVPGPRRAGRSSTCSPPGGSRGSCSTRRRGASGSMPRGGACCWAS